MSFTGPTISQTKQIDDISTDESIAASTNKVSEPTRTNLRVGNQIKYFHVGSTNYPDCIKSASIKAFQYPHGRARADLKRCVVVCLDNGEILTNESFMIRKISENITDLAPNWGIINSYRILTRRLTKKGKLSIFGHLYLLVRVLSIHYKTNIHFLLISCLFKYLIQKKPQGLQMKP